MDLTKITGLADDASLSVDGKTVKAVAAHLQAEATKAADLRYAELIRNNGVLGSNVKAANPGGGFSDGAENAIKSAPRNPYAMSTGNFKGLALARIGRAMSVAKADGIPVMEVLKNWQKKLGGDIITDYVETQLKALGESTVSGGGALVQTNYGEFIELLRADSVVRASGVRTVPMPGGNLTMTRQTGAATAYYLGENQNGTISSQTVGQERMSAKKLMALTAISNDLIRDASHAADVFVRDDLQEQMALRQDLAFLRGTGTEYTPKGLRYQIHSDNIETMTATPTLTTVTADLSALLLNVRTANVKLDGLHWYMHPRTEYYLMTLRDGNGNLAFAPEMLTGKLLRASYSATTQIPTNLGGGTESELYLLSTPQFVIGDTLSLQLDTFPNGTYHDGSNVISGISQDQTVIRSIAEHDCFLRHDKAASVLTGLTWGA
jgi:HK97 family phage major capsid protein